MSTSSGAPSVSYSFTMRLGVPPDVPGIRGGGTPPKLAGETPALRFVTGPHADARMRQPIRIGFDSAQGLGMLCAPNSEDEILWQS